MERTWRFVSHDRAAIGALEQVHGLSPILAQLMVARGITGHDDVRQFLEFRLSDLRDPADLPGVAGAADFLWQALQAGRQIWVYGDYDADGMTATAILYRCLQTLGGQPRYYVPNRMEDGYGLSVGALEQLRSKGAEVVVTVDCGIGSVAAADRARELGIDLIITDHHTMSERLPAAVAIVHPQLPGCHPLLQHLSGAGVALKLAWGLCQVAARAGQKGPPDAGPPRVTPVMREFLMMAIGWAAIGTVADVVPLIGENRILVHYGVACLKNNAGLGLRELMRVTQLDEKAQLRADDIGFTLAPRLNAAGRLGQAPLAVELLVTGDVSRAAALAEYIHQLNVSRDSLDRKIYNAAKKALQESFDVERDPAIVLADPHWHVGVIGIVAGRLADKYGIPTVLISQDAAGVKPGTGSCRSGGGIDLYQALESCQDFLEGFGGHQAAAGLQIRDENVAAFREAFWDYVQQHRHSSERRRPLLIDAEAALHQLTLDTLTQIEKMAPFGQGNPVPILCSTDVRLVDPKPMGSGQRHLSVQVVQEPYKFRAVAFGKADWMATLEQSPGPVDIAYRPVINEFRGYKKVELQLVDWRPAAVSAEVP
jgi:single-stranded-DNA-specific exonuclease